MEILRYHIEYNRSNRCSVSVFTRVNSARDGNMCLQALYSGKK